MKYTILIAIFAITVTFSSLVVFVVYFLTYAKLINIPKWSYKVYMLKYAKSPHKPFYFLP